MKRSQEKIEKIIEDLDVIYELKPKEVLWQFEKKWMLEFSTEAKNTLGRSLNIDAFEDVIEIAKNWYQRSGNLFRGPSAAEKFDQISTPCDYYIMTSARSCLFECRGELPKFKEIQSSDFFTNAAPTIGVSYILFSADFSWTAVFSSFIREQYFFANKKSYPNGDE